MSTYRSIWEKPSCRIPDGYEIHHIDGNRVNNKIDNLMCVSIEEHYSIHYRQGDYMACSIMSKRMQLTPEERKEMHKKAMATRDQSGEKNPMYGRSAIVENNMKWYNNGEHETMFTEGSEPDGYTRGRIFYAEYDKSGSNNPRARKAMVNGVEYDCLKDACEDYPHVPYSTMKYIAKTNRQNKYKLDITYV